MPKSASYVSRLETEVRELKRSEIRLKAQLEEQCKISDLFHKKMLEWVDYAKSMENASNTVTTTHSGKCRILNFHEMEADNASN